MINQLSKQQFKYSVSDLVRKWTTIPQVDISFLCIALSLNWFKGLNGIFKFLWCLIPR